MARKTISEYRAKTLLYHAFGIQYNGISITEYPPTASSLDNNKRYVLKVDQGIKGRYKKGLVLLEQTKETLSDALHNLHAKGYSQFIVEEQKTYNQNEEKYLSIERSRDGYNILYSKKGGVHVESNPNAIKKHIVPYNDPTCFPKDIDNSFLQTLLEAFDNYHFSFLEINPYIKETDAFLFIDAAVEVDSTAQFFVQDAWTTNDFTYPEIKGKTVEEKHIQQLADKSQAAFSFELLNPNGSIFMMLSGGGASIVLADEVHNQGYGKAIANYGEYSGNPNAEETYIYAKNVLQALLKSKASKKSLIIAGGVANFTDVRVTFKGLIKALNEVKTELQNEKIKIFVRRGGPYQEEGLLLIKNFLIAHNLYGIVAGPEMVLTTIVSHAIDYIK